jgi:hypothetical protein
MRSSFVTARRRLGLCAGALLAAGALALPAGASAGVTVHPATTIEGDPDQSVAVTTVDLTCGDPDPLPDRSYCVYDLRFEDPLDGDFVAGEPQRLLADPDSAFTVSMSVDVLDDTEVEDDETYTLVVEERIYSERNDFLGYGSGTGTYTAGTIVDDDDPGIDPGDDAGQDPGDDDGTG